MGETPNFNHLCQFFKTVLVDQFRQEYFEGNAVKWVVGLVGHRFQSTSSDSEPQ